MVEILSGFALALSVVSIILLVLVLKKLGADKETGIADVVREEFRTNRNETAEDSRRLREEVAGAQKAANDTVVNTISKIGRSQQEGLGTVEKRVKSIAESNETRLDKLRETVDKQMKSLQENNEKKLDQMRQTVDEKLQSTLEKRLGESFKLVSERLEAVQRGLGDMQNLAAGVGELKRVLTNVKTRGTWGEFQIGDILEQILSPDQYDKNVQPKPGSGETVEYAIRLPGQDDSSNIWLPIDSKFPQEDYQRLLDAADIADSDAVDKSTAALIRSIQNSAKDISDKYIDPPHTTDFAILFLPTEGLYSEVLRQPGMVEKLQQHYRIAIAGPTTLAAILNSLRMGFRTLAIEKRSSEVWAVLSAVKTEFGKFGDVLSTVKKQLDTASNTIEKTGVRTRAMERKLRDVEELPADKSTELLGLDAAEYINTDETD
ncbi:MAG: DNA recombination protein RmuC [Desulfobacterales bacterium]|nr:DNA recombination protein RmuC [Desulfobacterales bacterium]